ncbi:CrcB family protein [Arthrobacter sp. FW305-BF8]|uniref:fluoride efflux transporter FluC n=1 Tax=Arthrobacter sp. FW305-BF8 TaxID=2879617 RepID=UPI001F3D6408|nr:CrcB family protein [Arthrobacter sp. FW305-BF8]UKA52920.1 CrcB family protein [Arthrobacter sp. FW305-BF8]
MRSPLAGSTGAGPTTGYGWRVWTAVAAGGLLGTELRYGLGLLFPDQAGELPWATLGINLVGSFVLAALTTIWITRPQTAFWLRAAIGPGVLGSFTTFSAVVFSTDQLTRSGLPGPGLIYLGLSVLLGLAAAAAGWRTGRVLGAPRAFRGAPRGAGQ